MTYGSYGHVIISTNGVDFLITAAVLYRKGMGTLKRFLGLENHHVIQHKPNHMIAELAEPKELAPISFLVYVVGAGNETTGRPYAAVWR